MNRDHLISNVRARARRLLGESPDVVTFVSDVLGRFIIAFTTVGFNEVR